MNGIKTKVNPSTIYKLLNRLEVETNAVYSRKKLLPTYLQLDVISYNHPVTEIIFNYNNNKKVQWSTCPISGAKLLTWNKFIEEINNILEDKGNI